MLKEVLPLENSISASGSRHRIRTTGDAMDRHIEQEIGRTSVPGEVEHPRESERIKAVSVDSAWLKHCNPSWGYGRQVNIAAGRAILADGSSKVYAYVGKRVRSGAARLDHILTQSGVRCDVRVTIIRDGASEFTTAVEGSQVARGRILAWFHIAMKFRTAQQSLISSQRRPGPDWNWIEGEIRSAKWLVWHGEGLKAVPRLQAISAELEKWPDQEFSPLWWKLRSACGYVRGHSQYLVNHGSRFRKGLPISSSIAESAINQVVSLRLAKKRHMRWFDEGAHALALVRVADLNGELSPQSFGYPSRACQATMLRRQNGELAMAA
jgi:hypothetical protein